MASGPQVTANLLLAGQLISEAVSAGARFIVLPEYFAIMGVTEGDKLEVAEQAGGGPIQEFLSENARKYGIWICGGTVPIVSPEPGRVYAACLVYDDEGRQVARYDKIHLFDVGIPDVDEQYNESETILPGKQTVVFETPFARIGLAVCYDLRFPELFRELVEKGAEVILVPAAFTELTGKAHWDILVRARSIENLCYTVAAGQGGYHVNGRTTYGHSMIVDP
ncbi:MAG TPA: carbon-nitrogen hydrolase family protein, partial [Gammaproteobacteria bacterium]|nr:carbon-nitrogen hydrolase family protein [Gammaproteobacteria bacterium]